jgi:hypothetical protein
VKEIERRVIYHRDLGFLEWFEAPVDLSDFIWDFVGRIAGTHVDTLVLHITYDFYPTKLTTEEYVSETSTPVGLVGSHATWAPSGELTASSWRMLELKKTFVNLGIDPIAVLVEAAHQVGIDFFAGIRMNDIHHAQWDWHPKFWVEHPEFRIGDQPEYRHLRVGFREPGGQFKSQIDDRVPAALDYIHDEVRAYKLARIEEVARVYEVEGIDLDFTRHPFFFKPSEVDMGRKKMTEFVATVRQRLNEIGNERGRPVVLEVRVPPTIEACWRIGLDVRRWIGDNLVDIMSAAPEWHPDFGMPVEKFVDAAKGMNCKIFASFEFAEMPALENSMATTKVIRAATLAYWKAGVNGIYVFNPLVFPHYLRQEMPFLREIGDPNLLEYLDKHYMATRASNYDDVAWFSYPKELPVTLEEAPSGNGQKIHLKVGDDMEKAARLGITAAVTLRLRLMNLTSQDKIEFKFNGIKLGEETCKSAFFPMGESRGLRQYPFMADSYFGLPGPYHWLEFRLEKETLPRLGMNEVEVILRKRNPVVTEGLILNDVEIMIEYRK